MIDNNHPPPAGSICFGLNRETDEASLTALFQRVSQPRLLSTLVSRLSDQELLDLADTLFTPMHKHFSEKEYHSLFLDDRPLTDE